MKKETSCRYAARSAREPGTLGARVPVLARGHGLAVVPVQPTLVLVEPRPATGPRVLVRMHGPRLRLAPDAPVPLVQQRVDRNVVRFNVVPHLLFRPVGERCDLGRPVALLPRDDPRVRPLGGLLSPDACHPGVIATQGPLEWLDLADLAAQLGRARAHLLAVALDLFLQRERRLQDLQRKLVAPHDLLAELRSLPEDKASVDGEDGHFVGDLGDHVNERHTLAAPERGREREPAAVGVYGPLDYVLRVGSLQMSCQTL